jgi:hypothetical protein
VNFFCFHHSDFFFKTNKKNKKHIILQPTKPFPCITALVIYKKLNLTTRLVLE